VPPPGTPVTNQSSHPTFLAAVTDSTKPVPNEPQVCYTDGRRLSPVGATSAPSAPPQRPQDNDRGTSPQQPRPGPAPRTVTRRIRRQRVVLARRHRVLLGRQNVVRNGIVAVLVARGMTAATIGRRHGKRLGGEDVVGRLAVEPGIALAQRESLGGKNVMRRLGAALASLGALTLASLVPLTVHGRMLAQLPPAQDPNLGISISQSIISVAGTKILAERVLSFAYF
jgi:hypothetical protein